MTAKDKQTQVVVRPADMTLAELDESQQLQEDEKAGRMVALSYVWLKRTQPDITLEQVAGMSWRQVRVDASDDPQEDD